MKGELNLNYKFSNLYNKNENQLEIMQRNEPVGRAPQGPPSRPPQGLPSRPPQGPPSRPPQGPPGGQPQNFPGGRPQNFPPGPPPSFQPSPPPSFPGVAPVQPPMQERQGTRFPSPSPIPQPPPWQVDFRGIRRCLLQYTYVWLRNGNSFWFFPIYVVGQSIIGFRWTGYGWEYFTLNFRRISFYQCF